MWYSCSGSVGPFRTRPFFYGDFITRVITWWLRRKVTQKVSRMLMREQHGVRYFWCRQVAPHLWRHRSLSFVLFFMSALLDLHSTAWLFPSIAFLLLRFLLPFSLLVFFKVNWIKSKEIYSNLYMTQKLKLKCPGMYKNCSLRSISYVTPWPDYVSHILLYICFFIYKLQFLV